MQGTDEPGCGQNGLVGWRGEEVYASLVFTYIRSKVFLSLVWHFTYCVKVGRVKDREA